MDPDSALRDGYFDALQQWLAKGGYAPDWRAQPLNTIRYEKWLRNASKADDASTIVSCRICGRKYDKIDGHDCDELPVLS